MLFSFVWRKLATKRLPGKTNAEKCWKGISWIPIFLEKWFGTMNQQAKGMVTLISTASRQSIFTRCEKISLSTNTKNFNGQIMGLKLPSTLYSQNYLEFLQNQLRILIKERLSGARIVSLTMATKQVANLYFHE